MKNEIFMEIDSSNKEEFKYFNVRKSKNDKSEYLYKILKNNLKCLIIFDKDADKSAAALTVNVGSLCDPEEFQGIAHFLEHMLFMGTEKYPDENDFNDFLTKNSGDSNAYTAVDSTQYYFDIKNEMFLEALDRFAQFFINPLFNKSAVEREMKAVESEHKKNMRSDCNRFLEITRANSNNQTPFSKFQTGSLQTLKKPHIRKHLKKFHNEFYSSNIMNLCIMSNVPLEKMEKIIDELFGKIKELDILIKDIRKSYIPDQIYPYTPEYNLGFFYKIQNVKDKNSLSFYWVINENLNAIYKYDPLLLITSLLHHEGKNSLASSLLKDELITDLDSSYEVIAHTFSQVYLIAHLTDRGFKEYEEIIRRVLLFLERIQYLPISKEYFEEIQKMTYVDFEHFEKDDPVNVCSDTSENMSYYQPEDVLTGPYLIELFEENIIKKYLQMLRLDNLNIYFCSNKFEKEFESSNVDVEMVNENGHDCKEENNNDHIGISFIDNNLINSPVITEKWYGTKYKKAKFGFDNLCLKNNLYSYEFNYPPVNYFLPKNFALKDFSSIENLEKYKYPQMIHSKENFCSVWYKPDLTFKIPKAFYCAQIYLPYSHNGSICNTKINNKSALFESISNNLAYAHYEVYLTLWSDIFRDELREMVYMGSLARIDFSFYNNKMGLMMELSGFNDTLKLFAEEIFTLFVKISDYRNIENFRNKMLLKIESKLRAERNSFKSSANSQVSNKLNSFLNYPYVSTEKVVEILEELKKEILEQGTSTQFTPPNKFNFFLQNYLSKSYFEWLIQGNVFPEEALEMTNYIQNLLQKDGMKLLEINQVRTVKIPSDSGFYNNFQSHDEENENSAIMSYFQIGYLTEKESCLIELIEQILYDKFFDELRTKQALGYIVSLSHRFNRKIEGITCLVQSNVQSPEFILDKITTFFDDYNLTDENNITDEDFKSHVDALITQLKQKDLTLAEEVDRLFGEIKIREYVFNREEERIKIFQNCINKKDVVDFYEEHFIRNIRRLDIMLVAQSHLKDNEKILEKNSKIKNECENEDELHFPTRTNVKNEESFKRMCELYPDYYYYIK